jgi:hypothetical protein
MIIAKAKLSLLCLFILKKDFFDKIKLMTKKYFVILIIFTISLLAFFFPKKNAILNDSFTAEATMQYKNMNCSCLGFKGMKPGLSKSDVQIELCYGLPLKCAYSCKKKMNGQWQNIPCDK